MITVCYDEGAGPVLRARLAELGFVCREFGPGRVCDLAAGTAELVYVVAHAAMDEKGWASLRVELARANRLYVAYVARASTEAVVRCMHDGARDVVADEDHAERWRQVITDAVEDQRLWLQLYGGRPLRSDEVLLGRSEAIRRLRQSIDRLGPTDASVLIQGESGVGKERVAAALHKAGRGGPFVALNCAAIPRELLESELFGVVRGAYTGALKSRPGLVEQAHGGMLLLDEVGELDLMVQPKLLRFLETRRARRVGGDGEYAVDVRVVAATNRNLEIEVREKRFRPDLFFRLAEIILHVPPLRARPDDIPELAWQFMHLANERFGKNFQRLEPGLIERFQRYAWPGNVRELKSAIDRLAILFDGPILRASWWDLPALAGIEGEGAWGPVSGGAARPDPDRAQPLPLGRPGPLPDAREKQALARKLLAESGQRYSWVAQQLGIDTSTLYRWRKAGKLD